MLKLRVKPIHPWTIGQTEQLRFQHSSWLLKRQPTAFNSPKQAAGTMLKNCRTRSLAAWKQPCTFSALKTLRKLCPPDFIDTFYSNSYNSHAAEVMDKFFDKGVGTSPNKTALKRNRSQWGQQSEASSRNDVKELLNGSLAAWKQPWAFCALKTLCKLCPPGFIHTFYSHSYNSQAVEVMDKFFGKGVGTSPDKTALKRNRSQWGQQSEASSRNDVKELQNAKSGCLKTTLHFLCTQNLVQTLSSWFHSHFLLTLVQLSSYSTSESNMTRQNCSEKKWVSWRQQSEASSRNHAKELRNAKSGCLKTTLHFLCTQNLAQTLSSWFHSHFLLTLVQLSSCWSHGQILRQGSRDITRQNRSEKKSVAMGTTVRSKQSERCERTAEREVWLLENNLALFVHSKPCANFVLWISLTLFTQTRTTLMLLKSWTNSSTSESNITRQNCSEKKWGSMRTTVRSKQSEPCARTAERDVWLLENNLALFVHSKPCANFVLWISLTLFTQTRTTLMLLKSWTNSSTRESGHHQTKPLWKEIGLNGDNSPKQAVGTMRKNCGTRSLAAWKQPCTFCVLKKPCANFVVWISFTLFTHTRTTLKLFDKWVEHHQRKLLRKEMGINEEPGCFTLLPLSKESSSISQVKEAWRCGFVMLCTQRRFAFGMILPQEHIWQLVLATAPADWSWGLVLATGFLGKVQSQCSPEFCSAYIQEAAQQHSRVDNMPNFCKNSDWPTVPFLNLPCRQSCWKFVTHNAKHSTLDAGAFEIKDKAAGATKRAVTIMHKHISLLM